MKYYLLLFVFIINGSLVAQEKDFFDAQPTLKAWVKERVSNAANATREVVEFPMVVRSKAWGARCPYHYIGISPNQAEGPWLLPIMPKDFPVSDETGYSLIVTGYFTGKQIVKDYRKKATEPENWVYTLPEFKIISWRKNKLGYEVSPPKILK